MPWRLPPLPSPTPAFAQNTIELAVIEARFQPVTSLSSLIEPFHQAISTHFPTRSQEAYQEISILSPQQISLSDPHPVFVFSTPNSALRSVLSHQSLSLETTQYTRRSAFHQPFLSLWAALCALIQDLQPLRLGLRFVNDIDLLRVQSDLGASVTWSDLIHPSLLHPIAHWTDLDDARSYAEITSEIGHGTMTLRYGLSPSIKEPARRVFRLDVDRYQDRAFSLDALPTLLSDFGIDTAHLFQSATLPTLHRWLQPQRGDLP